jgi:hypothetical protein
VVPKRMLMKSFLNISVLCIEKTNLSKNKFYQKSNKRRSQLRPEAFYANLQ